MTDGSPITSRIARTRRFGTLVAGQGAKIAGGRALDRVRSEDKKEAAQARRTAEVVEQIVIQLGSMKGAAMKIGQVLSTVELPGMAAEDTERIQRRMAELRDNAPAVPFARLEKLMAKEWGEPVGKVLADIEPEALAAASIGQVHRATTIDGRSVAVKVQYPGIAEAVDADMRNLGLVMPLLKRIAPGIDTKAFAGELRERITEELDYELEASSQRRVGRLWRDHPHVAVPSVDLEHSTRRVLVTELLEGERFDDIKRRPDADRDRVAEIVHRFYYWTASAHDLALGDPHPGNWQLLPDGRMVIFDFGMIRSMPREYVLQEGPAIQAARDQEADALFEAMMSIGYLGPDAEAWVDRDLLLEHMTIASAWLLADQPLRLSPEHQRAIGEELFALGAPWREMVRRFSLPSEAVLLRRMADILFVACCQLRAGADWWALAEELQMGRPARTELGLEHAAWAAARA